MVFGRRYLPIDDPPGDPLSATESPVVLTVNFPRDGSTHCGVAPRRRRFLPYAFTDPVAGGEI
jgi:hypothetical protein